MSLNTQHSSPDAVSPSKSSVKLRRSEPNYYQVFELDKKMKREIANSNERRRMQSINTGFENLKQLLPMSADGEKLSKASILQLTAKYIQSLLSQLSTLEKEISTYKKSSSTKEDFQPVKEQTRKRRLNSCTTFEVEHSRTTDMDSAEPFENDQTFSLPGSELCLLTCEGSEKTLGSLEHLVAAIEQVEGERFHAGSNVSRIVPTSRNHDPFLGCPLVEWKSTETMSSDVTPVRSCHITNTLLNKAQPVSIHSTTTTKLEPVMKPTISPYTEKIILAVSQHPHMFNNTQDIPPHLFITSSSQSAFYHDDFHSLPPPKVPKHHKTYPRSRVILHENETP